MQLLRELYENANRPYTLAGTTLVLILLSAYAVYTIVQSIPSTIFSIAISLFMFYLIADAARGRNKNVRFRRWLIDVHKPSLRAVVFAGFVVLVSIVIRVGSSILVSTTKTDTSSHSVVDAGPPEGMLLLFVVIGVVIAGPLIEEIVFRGILQRFLSYKTGSTLAILITSSVFAAAHIPSYGGTLAVATLVPIATIFIDSTLWGILYDRTGNVTIPFIAHGSMNGLAMAVWLLL